MRTSDADIIIVPGLGNSDADHWQTRWESKLSTARRIEIDDWDHPDYAAWIAAIDRAVASAIRPVVLISHALGTVAIAHAAPAFPAGRVRGGFLVAPPSESVLEKLPDIGSGFLPVPREKLGFPALLVASANDPNASLAETRELAAAWGVELVEAGEAGGINAASGHGPWPEGLLSFARFMGKL